MSWRLRLCVIVLLGCVALTGCATTPSTAIPTRSGPSLSDLERQAGCSDAQSGGDSTLPVQSAVCTYNGVRVQFATFANDQDRERWITAQQLMPMLLSHDTSGRVPLAGHYAVGTGWAIECDDPATVEAIATTLGGVSRDD